MHRPKAQSLERLPGIERGVEQLGENIEEVGVAQCLQANAAKQRFRRATSLVER
jgi:hypothetical protein